MQAHYNSKKLNAIGYSLVAIFAIGLPLGFYLGQKYSPPIYLNVGFLLCAVSLVLVCIVAIQMPAQVYIDGSKLIVEKISVVGMWLRKSHDPYELENVTLIKKSYLGSELTAFYEVETNNGQSLNLVQPATETIAKIRLISQNALVEKTITNKQSYKLGLTVIGVIFADIALIFAAIYLGK